MDLPGHPRVYAGGILGVAGGVSPRVPSVFRAQLKQHAVSTEGRAWTFVPYDQLSDQTGAWTRRPAREVGLVLVETTAKGRRRPYHKQKLALILANQRQFALEQAARGVAIDYVMAETDYDEALSGPLTRHGTLECQRPAERELRHTLAGLVANGRLLEQPHEGWLTTSAHFQDSQGAPPYRMDAFYRHVRRATGILMEHGKPAGGKWSFDAENRKAWKGTPAAPEPPTFVPDEVTREVGALIEARFADHPGRLDLAHLPSTAADALRLWEWAKQSCLPQFGPFEDAMSVRSRGLFHTRIAPLLNLQRLLPRTVVRDVEALPIPLQSREGFIRQILGWREFVRHVHEATDGCRIGIGSEAIAGQAPLPAAYWGAPSGLRCLDQVVADVWDEGWSHHITRLMVLANLASLLEISPRELTDWFWVAFIDAFDWVVEPNVLGMGTYALGQMMTTKPYISGAAYIDRMSDYCGHCAFDPKSTCPVTPMYWAYLARHREALRDNIRVAMPLRSLDKRAEARRQADARVFTAVSEALRDGRVLTPADVVRASGD